MYMYMYMLRTHSAIYMYSVRACIDVHTTLKDNLLKIVHVYTVYREVLFNRCWLGAPYKSHTQIKTNRDKAIKNMAIIRNDRRGNFSHQNVALETITLIVPSM